MRFIAKSAFDPYRTMFLLPALTSMLIMVAIAGKIHRPKGRLFSIRPPTSRGFKPLFESG
jgi:hypothetical protein